MEDLTGRTLAGIYTIKDKIGSGNISDVYRAYDQQKAVDVAVKVLRKNFARQEEFYTIFKQGAIYQRIVTHPNIVPFYDFGRDGETVYLVMEWIDGWTLKQLIKKRKKPFNCHEVLELIQPICAALAYTHSKQIVHCDIKPSNILIRKRDDCPMLSDFGIARANRDSQSGGTPPYMAPEQFEGGRVTAHTDIYAMGVTVFEMLSGGHVPFSGESSQAAGSTLREKIYWEIRNLPYRELRSYNNSLPDNVERFIKTSLSWDPNKRFGSIGEFETEYKNAISETSSDDGRRPPLPPPYPSPTHLPLGYRGPYLLGLRGERKSSQYALKKGLTRIGRGENNEIRLKDSKVSRAHAVIQVSRQGVILSDPGSKAGVYVNGRLISQPVILKPGDQVAIGRNEYFVLKVKK